NAANPEGFIVLAPSSHMVEDEIYGDKAEKGDYTVYRMSFQINDSFKEAKSHAGEVEMLHTYAPESEYGEEGSYPYLAIQIDDPVYTAVEEFKEKGTFSGAMELIPLSGKFYFKAKMEYFGHIMYFYGMDRCDGYWKNSGLCMVYPKTCTGTKDEQRLMQILDEAAESYQEEKEA
ncbi:MAG: hypothetical protein K2O97_00805, partial [Acetatifactor sp.]|nr:hypothetical protein [Acetatifactor sp.]